jgi:hypothetical protein
MPDVPGKVHETFDKFVQRPVCSAEINFQINAPLRGSCLCMRHLPRAIPYRI